MKVSEIKNILKYQGIKPKKNMGQSFLLNESIAKKIISALNIEPKDIIIEVGSGLGILTNLLKDEPIKLFAIEKDKLLFDYLKKNIKNENVFLLNEDILKFTPPDDIKLVANLPYSITKKFLYWLIKNRKHIKMCILTLQKEVVEKILSPVGSKTYSAISVLFQYYMEMEKLFFISGEQFYPKSNVTSCVIKMIPKKTDINDKHFLKLVNKCFSNRRKKLKNIISAKITDIDLNRRPDNLSVEEYVLLTKLLVGQSTGFGKND